MQSYSSFDKGQDIGWWEALHHIANDSKHVRLVPQSVQSEIKKSFGWVDEVEVTILIDYSEAMPQLTNWSFYLFAKRNKMTKQDKASLRNVSKLLCYVMLKAPLHIFVRKNCEAIRAASAAGSPGGARKVAEVITAPSGKVLWR